MSKGPVPAQCGFIGGGKLSKRMDAVAVHAQERHALLVPFSMYLGRRSLSPSLMHKATCPLPWCGSERVRAKPTSRYLHAPQCWKTAGGIFCLSPKAWTLEHRGAVDSGRPALSGNGKRAIRPTHPACRHKDGRAWCGGGCERRRRFSGFPLCQNPISAEKRVFITGDHSDRHHVRDTAVWIHFPGSQ